VRLVAPQPSIQEAVPPLDHHAALRFFRYLMRSGPKQAATRFIPQHIPSLLSTWKIITSYWAGGGTSAQSGTLLLILPQNVGAQGTERGRMEPLPAGPKLFDRQWGACYYEGSGCAIAFLRVCCCWIPVLRRGDVWSPGNESRPATSEKSAFPSRPVLS
jgi:hypothetical protein